MPQATEEQLCTLTEIVNIGIGKAAEVLNELLNSHIELKVPTVLVLNKDNTPAELKSLQKQILSCVQLGFHGSFSGKAALVFPPESAVKLVSVLMGEEFEGADLDDVMTGTLSEVGNILINSVIGSISNVLEDPLDFTIPNYHEGQVHDLLGINNLDSSLSILLIRADFKVLDLHISGDIFLIFEVDSFEILLGHLQNLFDSVE